MAWRAATLTVAFFLHALQEADWRADEIETFAELVFEEALVAEVQPLGLIGENNKRWRRGGGLRDVVNFHLACCRGSPAIEVHFRKPTIQLACGDAPAARVGYTVDQVEKFFRAIAGQRGHEHDGRVLQKFQ